MGFKRVLFMLLVAFLLKNTEARDRRYFRSRTLKPTNEDRDFYVEAHNEVRSLVGCLFLVMPSATNMKELRWDRRLEHIARKYAKQCKWQHSEDVSRTSRQFKSIGENIAYKYGTNYRPDFKTAVQDALDRFNNERLYYDYESNTCRSGKVCGHYTQMIWAETEAVGCAVQQCPSMEGVGNPGEPIYFTVCNYGKAGNVVGQKPYVADPHGYTWYNLQKLLSSISNTW